ncbi:MAG TPA: polymer-forming cytoskeletal protein [Vicinamibacteria bacterium]|nr:polymer-forming cytoskeletal protein [Vicinamibacteria bacterium]
MAPAPTPPTPPIRRLVDTGSPATVIGPKTTVRGDVTGGDPVEIRGTLEGDCRISALCVVGEGARVLGNVEAAGLVVAGEIEAGTLAAERIEIRGSARVRGTITARVVAIADGAFYEGDVQMVGPDAPAGPVYFKDRRRSPDETPSRS